MNIEAIIDQFRTQAANASPLGGSIKFVLDDAPVYIDGSGEKNEVSGEDKDADCTITTSVDILEQLKDGSLNPMMAVMSGKVKISGDMGLAMKLQSLLG